MRRIRWARRSREDLRAIRKYIARDSRVYADRMLARIRKAVERIRLFPEAGARVSGSGATEYREIYVGNYRVIYEILPTTVDIVTVVHAARDLPGPPTD